MTERESSLKETPNASRVTNFDVNEFIHVAVGEGLATGPGDDYDEHETREQREERDRRRMEEYERWRQERFENLKGMLVDREIEAYKRGVFDSTDEQTKRASIIRGYALLLIIVAVVAMPMVALLLKFDPQAFGAFIAPVTGIAGTVVGYWFGSAERPSAR